MIPSKLCAGIWATISNFIRKYLTKLTIAYFSYPIEYNVTILYYSLQLSS